MVDLPSLIWSYLGFIKKNKQKFECYLLLKLYDTLRVLKPIGKLNKVSQKTKIRNRYNQVPT